jgi:hypothetical protein
MSIERIRGKINFVCDVCGNVLDTGSNEWKDAMAKMRADGWRSKKFEGEVWAHYCDDECWRKR